MKTFLVTPFSPRTAKEYLYTALSSVLGLFGFVYVFVTLSVGGFLVITLVGLPIIAVALYGARLQGEVQRYFAKHLVDEDIQAPPPVSRPHGTWAMLGAALRDGPGWRAMIYQLVRAPIATVYAVVLFNAAFLGVGFLTYPIWFLLFDLSTVDKHGVTHNSAIQINDFYLDTFPKTLLACAGGAVILLVAPWLLRATIFVDGLLMHGLLGPTAAEQRILDLTESRAHAVDDSAAKLRRIERDLHDGAQAQLVALAMQLGEAKENLETGGPGDLAETRALIDTAHRNAKQAINDLRDLARGIHPPALDNGLEDALATLTARTALPVRLRVSLPERPSPAVESIVYFCAAELLTNAAKHGRAQQAEVEISQSGDHRLVLRVRDDGRGGAVIGFAGGLAGLVDRVGTVDGTLRVDSPEGGPTVVVVDLPTTA